MPTTIFTADGSDGGGWGCSLAGGRTLEWGSLGTSHPCSGPSPFSPRPYHRAVTIEQTVLWKPLVEIECLQAARTPHWRDALVDHSLRAQLSHPEERPAGEMIEALLTSHL